MKLVQFKITKNEIVIIPTIVIMLHRKNIDKNNIKAVTIGLAWICFRMSIIIKRWERA